MSNSTLPRLALVLGDPAGIGPELIARLLADPEVRSRARVVLIADEDSLLQIILFGCALWKPGNAELFEVPRPSPW